MKLHPDSDQKFFDSQHDESVSSSMDTDLKETWSDSARKASAEARRAGTSHEHGDKARPEDQHLKHGDLYATPHTKNSSAETKARLAAANERQREAQDHMNSFKWNEPGHGPARAAWVQTLHDQSAASVESMRKDPGYARDIMETHLNRIKGIVLKSESTDKNGKSTLKFHDKLYDANGRIETTLKGKYGFKVTLVGKNGEEITTNDLKTARIKLKRTYYGGVANQSLRQQGISKYGKVGRTALEDKK